jgi:hypothetical protein
MAVNISGADIAKFLEQLGAKRERLRQQLEEVEREYDAVALTMKLMGQPTQSALNVNLSNETQLGALIAIAKANDGLLIVKAARRLMTKAGMFKTPANASSIIFTAISRSNRFEKAGKGKYKLLPEQAKPELFQMPTPIAAG